MREALEAVFPAVPSLFQVCAVLLQQNGWGQSLGPYSSMYSFIKHGRGVCYGHTLHPGNADTATQSHWHVLTV